MVYTSNSSEHDLNTIFTEMLLPILEKAGSSNPLFEIHPDENTIFAHHLDMFLSTAETHKLRIGQLLVNLGWEIDSVYERDFYYADDSVMKQVMVNKHTTHCLNEMKPYCLHLCKTLGGVISE